MSAVVSATVFPGDTLGTINEYSCGSGTYEVDSTIRASLVGRVVVETSESRKPVVNVLAQFNDASELVVEIGDIVYGRIVKINYNQAFVDILAVGDRKLAVRTKGIIRREDVRATEIDKVVVHDFFHSTDIVCARVISLGDNKQYYLSTADKNLGVVKRS